MKLESVQKRLAKVMKGLETSSCEEQWTEPAALDLQKEGRPGDITATFGDLPHGRWSVRLSLGSEERIQTSESYL